MSFIYTLSYDNDTEGLSPEPQLAFSCLEKAEIIADIAGLAVSEVELDPTLEYPRGQRPWEIIVHPDGDLDARRINLPLNQVLRGDSLSARMKSGKRFVAFERPTGSFVDWNSWQEGTRHTVLKVECWANDKLHAISIARKLAATFPKERWQEVIDPNETKPNLLDA